MYHLRYLKMNKSIYKFKSLKFYSPSKDGRNVPINHPEKENIYKNNYSSNQISNLRNIDINVNEDNSSPSKSYYQTNTTIPVSFNNLKLNKNTQKNNSAMKNKISNEIYKDDIFYKKIKSIPNKSINFQNRSNSLSKVNIKNRIQNIYSYKSYNANYNTNNDDDLNGSIFFPMDSVLEETNNMKTQEKKSSIPIHTSFASVVKLNNISKNNSFNANSINNNNNYIQVSELLNENKTINNINYLNNNFYTFNGYNQFNDNGYSDNFNYTYIYPYQNKILVSNEYI